jgi:hypothetical protein
LLYSVIWKCRKAVHVFVVGFVIRCGHYRSRSNAALPCFSQKRQQQDLHCPSTKDERGCKVESCTALWSGLLSSWCDSLNKNPQLYNRQDNKNKKLLPSCRRCISASFRLTVVYTIHVLFLSSHATRRNDDVSTGAISFSMGGEQSPMRSALCLLLSIE